MIGGGAIGLCAAYFLRLAGWEVTVIERNRCGSGASYGNAGWIVPSLSTPMPAPGVTGQALTWLSRPDSPVYIKPRVDPTFLRWLWRFWRACNKSAHYSGLGALASLNQQTMQLFDDLASDGVAFHMYCNGLIFAFLSPDSADAELDHVKALRSYGYRVPEHTLSGDELRRIEPALSLDVQTGFFLEEERGVDPASLIAGLTERLRQMGVVIREGMDVLDFHRSGGRVTSLRTTGGIVAVDTILLAAGAWTSRLAQLLNCRVPMEGGKGYSFSVVPPTMPKHALYLGEAKIGCSPFNDYLRVAGTMELSGLNLRLDKRRIEAMVRGAKQYLVDWADTPVQDQWAGLRPLPPDGLPIMDRLRPFENVYLSTGHGTLGITLAPASGRVMAEFIGSNRRPEVLTPFSVERF